MSCIGVIIIFINVYKMNLHTIFPKCSPKPHPPLFSRPAFEKVSRSAPECARKRLLIMFMIISCQRIAHIVQWKGFNQLRFFISFSRLDRFKYHCLTLPLLNEILSLLVKSLISLKFFIGFGDVTILERRKKKLLKATKINDIDDLIVNNMDSP